jgi:hypothetical protein
MEDVLSAIQSICPPQDAQALKTSCAALGIETCIIDNRAAGAHVIDGKVSTGSRYELFGDLDYSTESPDALRCAATGWLGSHED